MNLPEFFAELKRRHIYRVAVAYVVVAWLLIQIATQVLPFFEISNSAVRLVVLVLVLGFPVAIAGAWAFEVRREHETDARPGRRRGRWIIAFTIVVAVIAAGATAFHLLHPADAPPAAAELPVESKSIAVLPFENMSADKGNAYFVDGMRDEIVTSLGELRDLNVRSRTSSQRYKSHPRDLAVVSRELGVETVLEGRVQKAGDDVLINVQLIDARNGNQRWAQSYRRKVTDVFGVQGEVAQQVADALKIRLAPAQEERLHSPPTTNVRAHDLFLRAHALGAHSDEKSLEGKIAYLQEAVAADPGYAMAWGDLAGAYLTIADAYRAPLEVLGPMRHAALMAVKNDDGAGVGHIWLGAVSMLYDRNFPLAKSELERAVALGPNSSDAHRWLGWYLARVERDFDAGRAEVQRARALDPSYTWPIMFECYIAVARGEYESAQRLAEQVMEVDPHFFYDVDPIASVYAAEGRWQEAAQRYENLPAGTMTRPNFQLAICYANTGQAGRAQAILADLEALAQTRYVDQTHLAAIEAALGDKDKAFAALDRACADRSARVSTPRFYSWLAPLFADPRFPVLEKKVRNSVISGPWEAKP